MELNFQQSALTKLEQLADADKHSILIQGRRGCGKTFLAASFAKIKNIATFNSVNPKVNDLKEAINNSFQLQDRQVICIENLDDGVNAASQVILKYLEEPLPNTYIIVTCVNSSKLPDTIISRAISVELQHPNIRDLAKYAKELDASKYALMSKSLIFQTATSLSDVSQIFKLNLDQVKYFEYFIDSLPNSKDSVDQISWNMNHYPSGEPLPLKYMLRCIYKNKDTPKQIKQKALEALIALESKNLSEAAVLGKFALHIR